MAKASASPLRARASASASASIINLFLEILFNLKIRTGSPKILTQSSVSTIMRRSVMDIVPLLHQEQIIKCLTFYSELSSFKEKCVYL